MKPDKTTLQSISEFFKIVKNYLSIKMLKKEEMKYHVCTSIEGLLTRTNYQLSKMFGGDGKEIRETLKRMRSEGILLIGSENCEGFDPVKGCPGHPESIDSTTINNNKE